jgi:uncharacterized protein
LVRYLLASTYLALRKHDKLKRFDRMQVELQGSWRRTRRRIYGGAGYVEVEDLQWQAVPEPKPRFRRPVLSAGRRRVARAALHMAFLLGWFAVMLVFTPVGVWVVNWFDSEGLGDDQEQQLTRAQEVARAWALVDRRDYVAALPLLESARRRHERIEPAYTEYLRGARAVGHHSAGRAPRLMRLLVDGDALPGSVKEVLFRAVQRTGVPLWLVANKPLKVPESPLFTMVLVAAGADAADDWIAEQAKSGDLVVTADVPLASRAVAKGAVALDPRGQLISEANVHERLALRNLLDDLRTSAVLQGGGPPPFGRADLQRFATQLNKWLSKPRA